LHRAALRKSFPFDPLRDFTTSRSSAAPPGVLVVNPRCRRQDLAQFIAYAIKEPASCLRFPGNGTQGHLIAEQLKQVAGIEMTHVPTRARA